MNKEEVRQKIKQALGINSETQFVEFKDARGGFPTDPTSRTLSAFGNVQEGGVIVFGVAEAKEGDQFSVIGISNIGDLQERMSQLASEEMSAVLRLGYYTFNIDSNDILAVYVPEARNQDKPYHVKKWGMTKGAFIREGNTDRRMTENEVRGYIRDAQGDDYDTTCINDLSIDDLDKEKIEEFLEKSAEKTKRDISSDERYKEVLQNIQVAGVFENNLYPTLAGYLIFSEGSPQQIPRFERFVIRCVRYKGSGVQSDILDSADINGTLDEQIDGIQSFILRNIKKSASIVGTKRVERYEYPEKAIREIVANAVIHRNYRITETYTQINIFEDRIEVFNPGNLPPGVTVENIRDAQVSRNKVIAARLKDLDYLEEYGRGINIVFTEMSKWDLLSPIFKNSSNSFKVILLGEKLSELNDRQLSIWEYLVENNRITRKEAEDLLEGTPRQTISRDIKQMRDMGLVNQRGESKNTFYEPCF